MIPTLVDYHGSKHVRSNTVSGQIKWSLHWLIIMSHIIKDIGLRSILQNVQLLLAWGTCRHGQVQNNYSVTAKVRYSTRRVKVPWMTIDHLPLAPPDCCVWRVNAQWMTTYLSLHLTAVFDATENEVYLLRHKLLLCGFTHHNTKALVQEILQ